MKKTIIYTSIGLVLAIGGGYVFLSSNGDHTEAASAVQQDQKAGQTEIDKTTHRTHKVSQAELDKAAKDIGEIKKDDDFYYAMITLALQKLEFKGEDNSYHIPATADVKRLQFDRANLQYLKNRAVAIKASETYQSTLDRWLKGDFSNMENDYLTIRNIKSDHMQQSESPVLKVRNAEEEQNYIQYFFGDDGLQIHKRDWQ
ncbi:DUF6241 domain-containing protein [Neobacillus mesonae]|uniref:DUF6241 domain-containing protein n=1 Tax=Neobacillus mesonae TaxID=1193713 RepID=UPI00203EE13D|nr:DUF6241 domain-containing protein [Neobacillus mesonae]MCM3571408.1 DUF6241 domain-containing protein [Neobacillus mesonae]